MLGKSTLAFHDEHYIDLESSNFWDDGYHRHEDWYKFYCNIAEDLSRQGYTVFVSSHEVVRNWLKASNERVICIVPALYLEEQWKDKLRRRFFETRTGKDYKAWKNAEESFAENILQILDSDYDAIVIRSVAYELRHEIEEFEKGESDGT